MLTKLQMRIIDAISLLRDEGQTIGEITFYNALGANQTEKESDDIAEACRVLEVLGFVRDLGIGSTNLVRQIYPNYTSISFREIQRLEEREKWKELAYGFVIGILVTAIGGVIVQLIVQLYAG